MNTLQKTLSNTLNERNQERGYSISELSRRADIKRARVDRFLKQETTLRVGELSQLVAALDTSFDELLDPELLTEDLGVMQASMLQHLLDTERLHDYGEDTQLYWYHKTYSIIDRARPWGGPDLTDERLESERFRHLLVVEGEQRLCFGLGPSGQFQFVTDDEDLKQLVEVCPGQLRVTKVGSLLYGLLRYFSLDTPAVNISLIGAFANGRRIENRQGPESVLRALELSRPEEVLYDIGHEYELTERHQKLQHRVRKELDGQAARAEPDEKLLAFCGPDQLRNPHEINPADLDFTHFRFQSPLAEVEETENSSGFGLRTTFVADVNGQSTAISPAVALAINSDRLDELFDGSDPDEETNDGHLDVVEVIGEGESDGRAINWPVSAGSDEAIRRGVRLRRYVLDDYPLSVFRTDFELPDSIDELPEHEGLTFTLVEQDWFETSRDYTVDTPVQERKREKPGTVHVGTLKESYTNKSEHEPPEQLYLTGEAREEHTWIKGQAGRTSDRFLTSLARQDIRDGLPVIYMDFKDSLATSTSIVSDLDQRDALDRFCYSSIGMDEAIQEHSMLVNPFAELFESGQTNDPESFLSLLSRSVKAYLGESLYQRQETQQFIERLVFAAAYSGKRMNMEDLYLGTSRRRLREEVFREGLEFLKEHGGDEEIEEYKAILASETKIKETWDENDWKEKTHRVSSQIDSLNRGDLGQHLSTYAPEVSVQSVLDNNQAWVVQAPVSRAPQHAIFLYNSFLGVLQEVATSRKRNAEQCPASIYVDNFPYAMSGALVQHLRQSGSAGLKFHVNMMNTQEDLPGLEQAGGSKSPEDFFGNRLAFKASDDHHVESMAMMVADNSDGEEQAARKLPHLADDEVMACTQLRSDYPDPGVRGRSFPAVGLYEVDVDDADVDQDDIQRLKEVLAQRKETAKANRRVRRQKIEALELADKIQGERETLWEG